MVPNALFRSRSCSGVPGRLSETPPSPSGFHETSLLTEPVLVTPHAVSNLHLN